MFPYGGTMDLDARVHACSSKCNISTTPFKWSAHTSHHFNSVLGSLRELFYLTPNGTCYLGTYRCVSAGVYTPDEIAQFSPPVRYLT